MLYALYIWIYLSLNIEKLRYKLNMKARLTFNSAELTGHTIIVATFLESMQETVQVKIKSSTLVKLFKRNIISQKVDISTFHDIPSKLTIFWHTGKLLKTKKPLRFFEYLSTDMSSIRKCNKRIIFLWPFCEFFFFYPTFSDGVNFESQYPADVNQ